METAQDIGPILAAARAAAELLIGADPTVANEWRATRHWIDAAADALGLSLGSRTIPESFRPVLEAIHYLSAMLSYGLDSAARISADFAVTRAIEEAQRATTYAADRGRILRACAGRGEHRAPETAIPVPSAREDRACSDAWDRWSAIRPERLKMAARHRCQCAYGTCERCLRRTAGGAR